MSDIKIRRVERKDFHEILRMNKEDEKMLSPVDDELIEKIYELADKFEVVESDNKVIAYIIAYRENSSYWSDNYAWFNKRYDSFLYIDRIVVDKNYRKNNIASTLYERMIASAKADNVKMLTAEIDIEPEYNYASMKFHQKMGFHEVGTKLFNKTITVSLQIKEI